MKGKSTMQSVYEFLKKAGAYHIATIEGDQPRVRPFGSQHIFEGRLYIAAGKAKDVAKQIASNPKVELSAYDGKDEWLRVSATLVENEGEAVYQSLLEEFPSLKDIYSDRSSIGVYYLKDATAKFYSFTGEPRTINF